MIPGNERRPIGSKELPLDPTWSDLPVHEIEEQLLRRATFPELIDSGSLEAHEFVVIDPTHVGDIPPEDDLVARLTALAERLKLSLVTIGHHTSDNHGTGGFPHSIAELEAMDNEAFVPAFATLRDRIGWVLNASRFARLRHIIVPQYDAAMLAATIDLLTQLPAGSRPFVHLITRWDPDELPNRHRFGDLATLGRAIRQLNAARATTFLYAWSRTLARQLSVMFSVPVRPLDPPPDLNFATPGERQSDRFTAAFFGAPTRQRGFLELPAIVRATNRAATQQRRVRFLVHARESVLIRDDSARAARAELSAMPERNVSVIEEALPPRLYAAAMKQVDGVILPFQADGPVERLSNVALHAMAAGKLVFTYDTVTLSGVLRSRIVAGRTSQDLGEAISDLATDLAAARAAAQTAKATYWSTLRPSRLFAEILYGPVVLGAASGS